MLASRKSAVVACVVGAIVGVSSAGCATRTYLVLPSASNQPSSSVVAAGAVASTGDLLNGVYKTLVGTVEAQWTIVSTCTITCTASVSSSNGGWTGVATLTANEWDITVVRPNGATCQNGTTRPTTNHYSWDATTLKGAVDSSYACVGEPAGTYRADFTIVTPPISTGPAAPGPAVTPG